MNYLNKLKKLWKMKIVEGKRDTDSTREIGGLDMKIQIKRQEVLFKNTLDIDWNSDSIDIDAIRAMIDDESIGLKKDGKANRNYTLKNRLLRKKRKIQRISPCRVVYAKELMGYGGKEFVSRCYQKILEREADSGELKTRLDELLTQKITKIGLIYILAESEEGKVKGVKIHGYNIRYKLSKWTRNIFKIPIIGKVIFKVYKLFRVNSVLYQLMILNWELQERVEYLESLEQEVYSNSDMLQILEAEITNLKTR